MRPLPLTSSMSDFWTSFNPRICKRCDRDSDHLLRLVEVSIHASVKDATCAGYQSPSGSHCFNPRICKRCDNVLLPNLRPLQVSIHASVKDATGSINNTKYNGKVSIHASVKDATCFLQTQPTLHVVSIHASVKDATLRFTIIYNRFVVSIHASVKDATKLVLPIISVSLCFNPRICKRCDLLRYVVLLISVMFQSTHL